MNVTASWFRLGGNLFRGVQTCSHWKAMSTFSTHLDEVQTVFDGVRPEIALVYIGRSSTSAPSP